MKQGLLEFFYELPAYFNIFFRKAGIGILGLRELIEGPRQIPGGSMVIQSYLIFMGQKERLTEFDRRPH